MFKLSLLVNLELPHVQSICTKVSSLTGNGEPQNTEPELPIWLLVTVTPPSHKVNPDTRVSFVSCSEGDVHGPRWVACGRRHSMVLSPQAPLLRATF